MSNGISRFWWAMGLYALGVVLRGGEVGPLWLALSVLLVLNEVQPAWFRVPRWLRRPELAVISSVVFSLGALLAQEWDLDAWVWLAATGLFVWDAHERGELREGRRVFRELREAVRAPEVGPADGSVPGVALAVRRRAKIGLGICLVSLFLTWQPYEASGFVSWERKGTIYVDGAGRTVDDNTWSSPTWNDRSTPSSSGLSLPQGPFLALTLLAAAAVVFTRRYESARLRTLTFRAGGVMLVLCTYANGYAADALGWWVYLAGVGLFVWAAWEHHAGSRAAATAPE